MAHKAKAARRRKPAQARQKKRWTRYVTEHSHALDLQHGVFTKRSPRQIALSLKRSAERSRRRKAGAFRSALSMLTFYVNRAGHKLPVARKRVLQRAKDELRALFARRSSRRRP
jgi:hypothetical protein